MRSNKFQSAVTKSGLAASVLLLVSGVCLGQQVINLSAGPAAATLPDGTSVPMWGYSCGAAPATANPLPAATCAPLNPNAGLGWSPVVITVPTGQVLTINLTNNLTFTPTGATTPNTVPTSITIVGQIGGGLGDTTQETTTPSPAHVPLPVSWPTANTGATFNPPSQPNRVQSFGTEVAPVGAALAAKQCASPCSLTWSSLLPGTYLIESGTHPSIQGPMGLYGILVVTTAPTPTAAGIAYPNVGYDTDVSLLLSEIDPNQNTAVSTAVNTAGFAEAATRGLRLQPGPIASLYLQNAGGGYASVPTVTIGGGGGSGATATATIDPATGNIASLTLTSAGTGYTSDPTVTISGGGGSGAVAVASLTLASNALSICSGGALACYPPAVNYTPLYYMINGVAFDKTNATNSLFAASAGIAATPLTGTATGKVLVRLVNAGVRMHVPAIVGSMTSTVATLAAGSAAGSVPAPVPGFALIAQDGNVMPGVPRVQSEVFMAAGKTYDVMINGPAAAAAGGTAAPALAVYDRELSLSGNATERDAGMLAYIGINGASLPSGATSATGTAAANADTYNSLVAGQTLSVTDPAKGVIANDLNVYGVQLLAAPTSGTVTLNANGTFIYVPTGTATSDSFTYCANGFVTLGTCSSGLTATVALGPATMELASGISCAAPIAYASTMATYLAVKTPGVLATCTDAAGYPLTVDPATVLASGATVIADANGGFTATTAGAGTPSFTFEAMNSQGTHSAPVTVNLTFPAGSNLLVTVLDGATKAPLTGGAFGKGDYRWIIEEDRTFYIDPTKTTNAGTNIVPTLGVNFHTSYMPFVAQGCTGPLSCEGGQTVVDPTTGLHVPAVCDVSNGVCRPDATGNGATPVDPGQVALDPTKRYYISVLPGDAATPFAAGFAGVPDCSPAGVAAGHCGHGMGGAPIGIDPNTGVQASAVTVLTQPSPYPPAKLSVFVFEDDFPLNGEQDGGGGIDVISPNEPGLGGFQIHLWDAMGQNGDFTGQMTYDMFNQPLTNSLDGTIDPASGLNACPITASAAGITGMVVTCPKYESDGATLSPLAGQAVIANLMPMRMGVIATPAADRIARGEEWLQTNTLDGQKAHDAFVRIGEPSYFQEFGPASFHVTIGFANPAIINARHQSVCSGSNLNITGAGCTWDPATGTGTGNTIVGRVVGEHLSRTPDERLYGTGSYNTYYWTQCFVSFGDPDGEDFAFAKCKSDGTFKLTGLPSGNWRVTVFDQWNDMLVDGLSTPVGLGGGTQSGCTGPTTSASVCDMGDIAETQWQANMYTRTFIDDNQDGVSQSTEAGIPFANVAVRMRDGSLENLQATDFTGTANFNETFPLFSWYTVETDVTRYKNTGTHVVYDVGGPVDGSSACGTTGYPPCGTSVIGDHLASTMEQISVPADLRVPGAVYCVGADCSGKSIQYGPGSSDASNCTSSGGVLSCGPPSLSSGRIDPPWVGVEGWQGFSGENNFVEFGKEPYVPGENGGIEGHVVYASTRPFDDPQLLVQTQWEPLVPHVRINLYQEGFAADGITPTRILVDHTETSSWDDFAQGFHTGPDGVTQVPNMSCPGQGGATGPLADLFFFSLFNQPDYLDLYQKQHPAGGVYNPTATATPLPYNSQFKCYDGMHNWNQVQPAPYDGAYKFPSVTATDPVTGAPTTTNCTICTPDPVAAPDLYAGVPMLPTGKYVVEVVVPPGYELVKEEDKNILIGDNYIAPVTQQFGGLGDLFIVPDQAQVGSAYNPYSAQNPTQSFGATPKNGIVPGFVPEPTWPCVGEARIVPDYISLYPQTKQVAPFAGATRRLCDRKEVMLTDQVHAIAKFYVYTSTHAASKFTGGITDDYTSEFDPFSPTFGEKFSPPDLPVGIKDWAGNEIGRVYADHWGSYDGMTYSTWEVNPPNPTGYAPTMAVFCMNDPGPILDTRVGSPTNGKMIKDPLFSDGYSQFCYELPFMPGTTQYLDTPVVPTSAFAGAGYNNVDCAYPDATPAVASVLNTAAEGTLPALTGPWVAAAGHSLTINALGNQMVPNYAYSGPSATTAPFNLKTITRHYGFGTRCTAPSATSAACNTQSQVTIGGLPATITAWSDTQITVAVPNNVPNCAIQQQAQYGGPTGSALQKCGELVITAGNGKQSVDAVSVTIGGKTPTVVSATNPLTQYSTGAIQNAIDAAAPGDLLIIPPGNYDEMLLMWKPVRLQGVGAASSVLNANTQPAGKLDPWRREVNCLFGLALDGAPIRATHPYDSTGTYACGSGTNGANFTGTPTTLQYFNPGAFNPQIDRLPLEATVGWNATLNGNLAELLQEPTLMGALEGAGITVLAKGVDFPSDPFAADTFPTGTTLVTAATCGSNTATATNPFPSNFWCNPSRIDGLSLTDSSQGGGAIFVHAWGHNLEIANNRIQNNAGTLSGGINVGQGEFAPSYINGGTTNGAPGSCSDGRGIATGAVLPYCENMHVDVHNNYVSLNSSTGDELFSATPAGAGGVSFCTGADYYKFHYNWVCGNLSSGDGGGVGHLGLSYNGLIEHNTILFNQSLNPTIPANGGGIVIMGTPDVDPPCGALTDQDCVPPVGTVGPSDGIGPGLVVNANLIMGNAAEAGAGGGIALQHVNGSDVVTFPTQPSLWHSPTISNNIIADNVAGWDGGGISLLDALNANIVNNTIVANTTTASAGILFTTLGAPLASTQGPGCTANCGVTSPPQPAGIVSIGNTATLMANLPATVTCPANHYAPGTPQSNGSCRSVSYPELDNDVIWQNSSYNIGVGALSAAFQQNVVSLYNAFTSTLAPSQTVTGQCTAATYWDIGVRGDTGPGNHGSGFTLAPTYSVLTSASENGLGTNNLNTDPTLLSQYCDGSRQPPEFGASGWSVPPGIADATVPNPIFNLTPVATVDEGNNWINLRWGPLSLTNPSVAGGAFGNWGGGAALGNYAPAAGSPVIDYVSSSSPTFAAAPDNDFFGNPRKTDGYVDVGAVEYQSASAVAPSTLAFGTVTDGATATQTLHLTNGSGTSLTGITLTFPAGYSRFGGTCTATLGAHGTCTIVVRFAPTAAQAYPGSIDITASAKVYGAPVSVSGSGVAAVVSASVSPGSLAFGNWATFTSSTPQTLTVQNTGNVGLTFGKFTAVGGPPFAIVTGGSCGTMLAAGASCTIRVQFTPSALTTYSRTLTVAYTSATVTPASVALTGAGVAAKAAASIAPNPLTITLPSCTPFTATCLAGTGVVTLTNTAPLGGSQIAVTGVSTTGSSNILNYFFLTGGAALPDTCTGTALAPGASCTVTVEFTNALSPRGASRSGTIRFADTAAGAPTTGVLTGFATP